METLLNRTVIEFDAHMQTLIALITESNTRTANGFDAMAKRLDAMDKRFDAVDKRFDAMDERFDKVDIKLDEVEGKLNGVIDVVDKWVRSPHEASFLSRQSDTRTAHLT